MIEPRLQRKTYGEGGPSTIIELVWKLPDKSSNILSVSMVIC